ncbi:hypothetical protein [Streptomyces lunalinharesii]|uniref:hypothetical protein n=1 Tax=Streptomyces lunalinharesii TaxID=333384 RepID=UPI0031CF970C
MQLRGVCPRSLGERQVPDQIEEWNARFGPWLREGRNVFLHTVVEGGTGQFPAACAALLDRTYSSTMLVRMS